MGMAGVIDLIKDVLWGWQVTAAASVIITAIIIITLAIWVAMKWRYGGVIAKKDATIELLGKTINLAKDQRDALAREIENLNGTVTTLKAQASTTPPEQLASTILHVGSIAVNITRLNEQMAHTLTGVGTAVGVSAITDTISDLYSNTPLVLREQAEADKERPR
jgi:hypothetical protein